MIAQHVPEDPRPFPRILSGGGTITDAIYDAIEKFPSNKHCESVVVHGISNTIGLSEYTPDFVTKWMKHDANLHHCGARYTPHQSIQDAWEAEQHWRDHKDLNQIKVDNCPPKGDFSYRKLREK